MRSSFIPAGFRSFSFWMRHELIPDNNLWINQIFKQIETIQDDNNPFFIIISQWFDNLAYLIHEHTQFETLPIFIHICQVFF